MLKRHIKIRQHEAFGHQGNEFIHVRIGIHVMQAYPHAQFAECPGQAVDFRVQVMTRHEVSLLLQINAVGARVLGDHQQFTDPGLNQLPCFFQNIPWPATGKTAAHGRDNAKTAFVITSFRDLEISIMSRRQLDTARRQQVIERLLHRRHLLVYSRKHLSCGLRTSYCQQLRELLLEHFSPRAEASGHDYLTVRA